MAQRFRKLFSISRIVPETMEDVFDGNSVSLQTNFEGDLEPDGEAANASQWYSDTTSNLLRIREQTGGPGTWFTVFDFTNQEVYIKDGQIGTDEISSSARMGSIVQDQAISPSSCTEKAKFLNVSLPSVPNEFFENTSVGELSTSGVWVDMLTTMVYVPSESGTLHIRALQHHCEIRFSIGGNISSASLPVTTPAAWGTEATYDTSGLLGWQELKIQARQSSGTLPISDAIGGIACRWEVI